MNREAKSHIVSAESMLQKAKDQNLGVQTRALLTAQAQVHASIALALAHEEKIDYSRK